MIWTATRGGRVDVASLRRVGARFGVTTWPVVLDLLAIDDDAERARAAHSAADARIAELRLVDDVGDPVPWLATALRVLALPDRELEIRTFTESDTVRACLARRDDRHVFAVRSGDTIDITVVELPDVAAVSALVRRHCTDRGDDDRSDRGIADQKPIARPEPLEFGALACPCDELADRLGRCLATAEVARTLTRLGMPPGDSGAVARAFATIERRIEVVAVSRRGGMLTQSPGALGVIDTARGRIVAGPSRSPDGRVWTTLSPGSGHRIGQAVGLLIETLPDGWWPR